MVVLALFSACSPPYKHPPADDETGAATDDTGGPAETGDTGEADDETGDDSGEAPGPDTGEGGEDDTAEIETGEETGTVDSGEEGDPFDTGGDTAASCTDADLLFSAEVRDAAGVAGTSFVPSDALWMVGVISNPCASNVSFRTSCSGGFLSSMSVVSGSGLGMGMAMGCDGVRTTWTVTPGGTLEEGYEFGRMGADSYGLTVDFGFGGHSASQSFTVR